MQYTLRFRPVLLAVRAGRRDLQHEYTLPILEKTLQILKLPKEQIRVAKALVDNDVLGDLLKGEISLKEARRQMSLLARRAGMDEKSYFKLQALFYTADAASYPFLYEKVFAAEKNGKLVPRDPIYRELEKGFLD